jgi:hypothetical protein
MDWFCVTRRSAGREEFIIPCQRPLAPPFWHYSH